MRSVLIVAAVFFTLSSCDDNAVYDKYTDVDSWKIDDSIIYEVEALDSLQPHNVFITLRNNYEYSYSNLFMIAELDFPNGRKLTDTLEYEMAAPDGTWLGSGFSDVKESKLWYKEGVRFRESGTYTFSLRHAMRKNGNVSGDQELQGITQIGLRIETQQ